MNFTVSKFDVIAPSEDGAASFVLWRLQPVMSLLPDVELSTKVMTMNMLESLVHIMALFEIDSGISLVILRDES